MTRQSESTQDKLNNHAKFNYLVTKDTLKKI